MSEVHQSISYNLRGGRAGRGGRGGSSGTRGGSTRSVRNLNGGTNTPYSNEDEGQLKTKYSKLSALAEMFDNLTREDLASLLEECNNDLDTAVLRITEGPVSQWEVKKGHRARPNTRPKASPAATADSRMSRGNSEAGRSRGRVTGPENRNNPHTRPKPPPPNGVARQPKDLSEESVGETVLTTEAESAVEAKKKLDSSVTSPPTATTNTLWTTLFKSTPTPAPVPKRVPKPVSLPPAPTPAPETKAAPEPKMPESNAEAVPPQEPTTETLVEPSVHQVEAPVATPVAEQELESEVKLEVHPVIPAVPIPTLVTPAVPVAPAVPATLIASESPVALTAPVAPTAPTAFTAPTDPSASTAPSTSTAPVAPIAPTGPAAPAAPAALAALAATAASETPTDTETPEVIETIPSPQPQQPLTEVNLEKIEDVAPPAPTGTQASTIASPAPTPSAIGGSIAPPPTQPVATTPRTAYAVAMPKSTPRSKFRTLTQQEPVIMPSPITHNAVEHPTLQFGSMGLGDEDGDEAEPVETVSQPTQPSQIAQPISAPPPTGPTQAPVSQPPVTEALPTRQAPGLPVHPQVAPQQSSSQPPLAPQSMTHQHLNQHMPNQYNRYEIPNPQQQPQAKPFDTFGPPTQQPAPQTQNQPQNQPQQSQPHQQPSHIGIGVSTTPDQHQYNNYYDRTQPPGFGNLYNSTYMQQGQSQQDAGANQQRASSGLGGAGEALGQVPTSAPVSGQVQQPTSRYGAQSGEQSSGHGTPSPAITAAQQTSQPHQPGLAQYPGGMPSYGYQQHPYYSQFMHQSYYNHPNPFGKHQGMYGYPQAYMSPQYSDHSSSPAGLGGFGTPSTQGRENGGLGDYGRMNATASQQQQQQQSLAQHSSASAYGNSNAIPNFLGSRGLPEQQQLGSGVGQQVTQQTQNDDPMKFGENKPPTGPSSTPSIQGQPGRPGSATSGANMGPQHGAQAPGGVYGTHLNHNLHQAQQSQYGQAQTATSQYSMYGYPHYGQSTQRHANAGNWGAGYGH